MSRRFVVVVSILIETDDTCWRTMYVRDSGLANEALTTWKDQAFPLSATAARKAAHDWLDVPRVRGVAIEPTWRRKPRDLGGPA